MTTAELDQIEAALGLHLPAAYREVSRVFPFRPSRNDWVYWFYDEPDRVINETLSPLEDGEYDRADWKPGFVVIGQSACGDLYVLDTTQDGAPVFCLSHEDHSLVKEFPSFEAYIAYWQAEEAEADEAARRRDEESRQQQQAFDRQFWKILLVLVIGCALCIGLLCLIPLLRDLGLTRK